MAAFPTTSRTLVQRLGSLLADLLGRSQGLGFLELDHEVVPGLSFGCLEAKSVRGEEFLAVLAQERGEQWV